MESESPDATADYDWLTLEADEEVVWAGSPHAYSLVPALVVGIPLSVILVGIVIIVAAYLQRENTDYVVTTRALYAKSGVFSRDVQRIDFEKVQNISYSQGALGKQFGYGNVDISTAGGSGIEMQFRSIPDPKDVSDVIKSRVRAGATAEEGESAAAVLDDILGELRAIRAAVERDGEGEFESVSVDAGDDERGGPGRE